MVHSESIIKYSCTCSKEFGGKDAFHKHKTSVMEAHSTLCSIYSEEFHQSWWVKCHTEQKHRCGLICNRCQKTYKKKELYENNLQLCFATASKTNDDGDNLHEDKDIDVLPEEVEPIQEV